jgi:hypothetical protein
LLYTWDADRNILRRFVMTTSKRRSAPQPAKKTPDITAQPRPIMEEMISGKSLDDGLSVDPEDLGSHFLSEATEQGNFQSVHGGQGLEMSLASAPPVDAESSGPDVESDTSVWDQTVDLALQNAGTERTSEVEVTEEDARESRTSVSHIRELSLFDREGAEAGETTEPEALAEDGGRHARQTSYVPLGAQVEDAPRRDSASELDANVPKIVRRTRSALKHVASKLRGAANKLESHVSRSKRS